MKQNQRSSGEGDFGRFFLGRKQPAPGDGTTFLEGRVPPAPLLLKTALSGNFFYPISCPNLLYKP
jgi:hypothetical protein